MPIGSAATGARHGDRPHRRAGAGSAALGQVIAGWVEHFLAVAVDIEPLVEARDIELIWYVGLDAQATRIGDTLWNGEEVDEATRARVVGLYRLAFRDPREVLDEAKGEPIYLLMAMTPDGVLRMKPQNLLTGLPVKRLEPVS